MPREVVVKKKNDPIRLLAYSWTVEADDELDALFKAMERASRVRQDVLRRLVGVIRVDFGLYVVQNKDTGSSIIARVTPAPQRLDPASMIAIAMGRPAARTGNRYYVTFYPRTFRSKTVS